MSVGEWDQRQLCPDGSCIGVIGPDGTCKVCGHAAPNWGDERNRGLIDPPDEDEEADDEDLTGGDGEDDDDEDGDKNGDDDDDEDEDDDDDDDDAAPEPSVAAASRDDWAARRLCSDGSCIGVIGPDGRCKVCGRRASVTPVEPSSEPATALTPATPAAATPGAAEPAAASAASAAPATTAAPAEPAASDREPCTTPGCSGQIGADGRCAVCGKGAS